jgi:hypothetical protein
MLDPKIAFRRVHALQNALDIQRGSAMIHHNEPSGRFHPRTSWISMVTPISSAMIEIRRAISETKADKPPA